ncbi:hypothetical protein [Streptomyces sp. NPDC091371]|uniref:hypothetical protein n=1 Tax=Streptomyces sp. NPDC091371 TaxID=3155303 RepID=UPI003436ABB6
MSDSVGEFPRMVASVRGSSSSSGKARFFTDSGFKGSFVDLSVGEYPSVPYEGGDDSISSVKVPLGFKVTLYEHADFGGASHVITASTEMLDGFDNKTSSIKVESRSIFSR